ncbi:unnamed protein product, partial [Mesorhabditis spiculigera]
MRTLWITVATVALAGLQFCGADEAAAREFLAERKIRKQPKECLHSIKHCGETEYCKNANPYAGFGICVPRRYHGPRLIYSHKDCQPHETVMDFCAPQDRATCKKFCAANPYGPTTYEKPKQSIPW